MLRNTIFLLIMVCMFSGAVHARQFSTNGFLSVGAAQSDAEAPMYGVKDEINFSSLSLIGIQTVYQPSSDRLSFVVQLLARGADGWDMDAEWAYAKFKINDNNSLFLGKIRMPFFMISEQYDVGVAYPWIRPPEELYGFINIPFTTVDGIKLKHRGTLKDFDYGAQIYAGNKKNIGVDVAGISVPETGTIEMYGVTFNVGNEVLKVRLGYHEAPKITLDLIPPIIDALGNVDVPVTEAALALPPFYIVPVDNGKASFASIGFTSNMGNLFLMGEWGERDIKQQLPFPTTENWFFTAGYNGGKFVPHITFGEFKVDDTTLFNQNQQSVTLGLRYNATPSTAVKFEIADIEIDSAANAVGLYDSLPQEFNGIPLDITPLDEELTIVRFVVNMVF